MSIVGWLIDTAVGSPRLTPLLVSVVLSLVLAAEQQQQPSASPAAPTPTQHTVSQLVALQKQVKQVESEKEVGGSSSGGTFSPFHLHSLPLHPSTSTSRCLSHCPLTTPPYIHYPQQALERELRELRKASRMHALYEKNSKGQLTRINELQKKLSEKEQEVSWRQGRGWGGFDKVANNEMNVYVLPRLHMVLADLPNEADESPPSLHPRVTLLRCCTSRRAIRS